jgi:hypothetical protein
MKSFANVNARDLKHAVAQLGHLNALPIGGGSDLLGMVKEHLVEPDLLVNLKTIRGLDQVSAKGAEIHIGGLITPRRKVGTPGRWRATSASGRGAGITATISHASRTAGPSALVWPAKTSSMRFLEAARVLSCTPQIPLRRSSR